MDEELLRSFYGLGSAPLIVAVVEGIKRMFPNLEARWYPLVSLAVGVVLNLALCYLLNGRYEYAVFIGILASLIAGGLWSGGKAAVVEPIREAQADAERAAPRG